MKSTFFLTLVLGLSLFSSAAIFAGDYSKSSKEENEVSDKIVQRILEEYFLVEELEAIGIDSSEIETYSDPFGAGFSNVRIHPDASSSQLSSSLSSKGFSHGNAIFFSGNQYGNTDTHNLAAHELNYSVKIEDENNENRNSDSGDNDDSDSNDGDSSSSNDGSNSDGSNSSSNGTTNQGS